MQRINYYAAAPTAMKAMMGLDRAILDALPPADRRIEFIHDTLAALEIGRASCRERV